MIGAAEDGAGFIAVLSDKYVSRYWCRREVEAARTPRRVCERKQRKQGEHEHEAATKRTKRHNHSAKAECHVWTVCPTVVAVSMDGDWSRLVGELATVPARRWHEEKAAEYLDVVFREALLAEFHRQYAAMLFEKVTDKLAGRPEKTRVELLTWVPDAASALRVLGGVPSTETLIAYPGHGLLPDEERKLEEAFGGTVRLMGFEALAEVLHGSKDGHTTWDELFSKLRNRSVGRQGGPNRSGARRSAPAAGPLIALSAGDASDLAALGYDAADDRTMHGSLHVDASVTRIARAILQNNMRIAYGGRLRNGHGFTELLLDTVAGTLSEHRLENKAVSATPLVNLQPWPHYRDLSAAKRAESAGLLRYVDVPPSDTSEETLSAALKNSLDKSWYTWLSSQRMRKRIAEITTRSIATAGKLHGFMGALPGVAEEVLFATEVMLGIDGMSDEDATAKLRSLDPEHVSVLLLGAYGGATRQLVRYILDPNLKLPKELTLDWQRTNTEAVQQLLDRGKEAAERVARRYRALEACLDGLRRVAQLPDEEELPRLGMDVGTWKRAMRTESPAQMRALAIRSAAAGHDKARGPVLPASPRRGRNARRSPSPRRAKKAKSARAKRPRSS